MSKIYEYNVVRRAGYNGRTGKYEYEYLDTETDDYDTAKSVAREYSETDPEYEYVILNKDGVEVCEFAVNVDFGDHTECVENIVVPNTYDADDYIKDCMQNADDDWCEMLKNAVKVRLARNED